jgi:hypothetical protein
MVQQTVSATNLPGEDVKEEKPKMAPKVVPSDAVMEKKFYQNWWFWVIVVVVILGIAALFYLM